MRKHLATLLLAWNFVFPLHGDIPNVFQNLADRWVQSAANQRSQMGSYLLNTNPFGILNFRQLSIPSSGQILNDVGYNYNFPDSYPEVYETVELLPFFCHGWNTYNQIFDPLLAEQKFKTVIEVGVFLGNWTIYVAQQLPPGSRYFAVDHWKGSEEHMVSGSFENNCLKNMYQQFLSNMIHSKLTDKVIPVRMNSLAAAKKFTALNIKADLIYIDAAHDFISVYRDLNAWFPMLAENGMFCGDDWHYGGVRTAVQQFAENMGFAIIVDGNFWQLEINKK